MRGRKERGGDGERERRKRDVVYLKMHSTHH